MSIGYIAAGSTSLMYNLLTNPVKVADSFRNQHEHHPSKNGLTYHKNNIMRILVEMRVSGDLQSALHYNIEERNPTVRDLVRTINILTKLQEHGLYGKCADEFLKGGHFRLKDAAKLFNELKALEGAEKRFSSHFASDLLDFVKMIHKKYTSDAPFPIEIENARRNVLDRYAYNLVLFRACVVDKNLFQKEGRDYLELLSSSNEPAQTSSGQMYLRNLVEGNPFLIKQHVSELFNVLRRNQDLEPPKDVLDMLSKEIEVNLMEAIGRLNPQYYRGITLMLTGYREMLLDKLMMSHFPDRNSNFEAHQLFCSNAEAFLSSAKNCSEDASLQIYNEPRLIRDFTLGATIDDSLNLVQQMKTSIAEQMRENNGCIQPSTIPYR